MTIKHPPVVQKYIDLTNKDFELERKTFSFAKVQSGLQWSRLLLHHLCCFLLLDLGEIPELHEAFVEGRADQEKLLPSA